MNNTVEQFTATQKANLQSIEGMSTQAFAGVEKLVELNMAASKAAISESFSHMQALMGVKDAKELMAVQAGFFKPMAQKSAAYFQHVQGIATGGSADFTKTMEAKMAEAQKAFGAAVEQLAKNAPAGSEAAVAAFKNALTSSQTAVETAQATIKKATEAAQANFTAAAKKATQAA
ncbi:phasin family protein [Hydrogenophaga sp.]|uniref:phasin family protein n=1 Tax=Hydrogenophaga sp. TaxID=1904254 RepID=UPI0035682665